MAVRVSGVVRERVIVARRIQVDAIEVVRDGIVGKRVAARMLQVDAVEVVRRVYIR